MDTTRQPSRPTGETEGTEQEPNVIEDRDPAHNVTKEEAGGPLQPDPNEASDDFGGSPDAAYGQREGQAEEDAR